MQRNSRMKAALWEATGKGIRCNLCSHRCLIQEGQRGICGVRENAGELYTLIYGKASSIAIDPIEKKPLFHFKPGTSVFSLGTIGCNFRCLHCQNNDISCASPESFLLRDVSPQDIVKQAKKRNCSGIAWTYNEPTIWYEFTKETSELAKKNGLSTIYVTNGYITPEALKGHAHCLDAMNIDVKAFTEEFYNKIVGARLQPVLETCKAAKELGIHVELTYLIIPGHNDTPGELEKFASWVNENMGSETPIHLSRFHPSHKMRNTPPTTLATMDAAYNAVKAQGLRYVYVGNVHGDKRENTHCPNCKHLCIERTGFTTKNNTKTSQCPQCKQDLNIRM